jgi:acetyltransferase-like isoleucine patch superfamily enzyme/acyl carrier protein
VVSSERISLGRPIANTQLFVLTPGQQLAPLGIAGDLHIGGEGVARGYWKRPDLTAAAFVPHPFDTDPTARLYRTGDTARYLGDGTLEFLGRTDQQVKIRGYRVELGEIEARLRQHSGVRDAVVVARPDVHGDTYPVAYVVPSGQQAASTQELRAHLAETLPDYMVVSSFLELDAVPLTASGKVDRKALPEPALPQFPARPTVEARLTATHAALVAMWSELLQFERPGLDDSLFDLGGHSLTAVRLVALVQQRLSAKLPVTAVFAHPTIRSLSSEIDRALTALHPILTPAAERTAAGTATERSNATLPRVHLGQRRRLGSEHFLFGPLNRVLQFVARSAPGALRPTLHRWRGVAIGEDVLIGYDTIIETSYPWLVSIGHRSAIGMRVTIIGHFLGMEQASLRHREVSVDIGAEVWVGPGSLILPNVTIGDGAVVAAGSVVSGVVPSRTLVQGNPARVVARCSVPLRPGSRFEDFLQSLEPLDGWYGIPSL